MLTIDEITCDAIQPEAITRYICRHIFTDGRRCGSVCLRHQEFCYYHHTARRPVANPLTRKRRSSTFDLPLIEDRGSVQSSIAEVLRRIAANDIDARRAGLLLYGLQIAAANMPRLVARRDAEADTPALQMVEEVVLDSANGPLAPQAVFNTEEEQEEQKSIAHQLVIEMHELERSNDKEWYESLVKAAERRTEEANRKAEEARAEAQSWKESCQHATEASGIYYDRWNSALNALDALKTGAAPPDPALECKQDAAALPNLQAVAAKKITRCRTTVHRLKRQDPAPAKRNAELSPHPLVGREPAFVTVADGKESGGLLESQREKEPNATRSSFRQVISGPAHRHTTAMSRAQNALKWPLSAER